VENPWNLFIQCFANFGLQHSRLPTGFWRLMYTNFERGKFYALAELRRSEAQLLNDRQQDKSLSAKWRAPTGDDAAFINVRSKELYPLMIFARHKKFHDEHLFRIMKEGDPVDAQLSFDDTTMNVQITVADIDWESDKQGKPGYQNRLSMEALNARDVLHGHGPFRREKDGQVVDSSVGVYSAEQRILACSRGLERAFQRKMHHDGLGCDLLVYARAYHIQTVDGEFEGVVRSAIAQCGRPMFDNIYVFDEPEGWFAKV
jgi:hypothetical protein